MGKFDLHGTKYINDEGYKVPSVTTIINQHLGWNKQALINWAKRITLGGQDADKVLTRHRYTAAPFDRGSSAWF